MPAFIKLMPLAVTMSITADVARAPRKVANAERNFENFNGTTCHHPYFALPPILPYNFAAIPTTPRDERTQ